MISSTHWNLRNGKKVKLKLNCIKHLRTRRSIFTAKTKAKHNNLNHWIKNKIVESFTGNKRTKKKNRKPPFGCWEKLGKKRKFRLFMSYVVCSSQKLKTPTQLCQIVETMFLLSQEFPKERKTQDSKLQFLSFPSISQQANWAQQA